MNVQETEAFFDWAQSNLLGFTVEECEESHHYYLNGVMIGGWAGDTRQTFFKQNDALARALRMYDAYNAN